MNVAVSSLAWRPEHDAEVARLLADQGVNGVELAPTKIWPDLRAASSASVAAYRDGWTSRGFQIIALQAILFGRNDLQLFESEEQRRGFEDHLRLCVALASGLGAPAIVLGAPGNRRKGSLSATEAEVIAIPLLSRVGEFADAHGVVVCIEPAPHQYGGDWVTSTREAVDIVRKVDSAGISLHLDAGILSLEKEDCTSTFAEYVPFARHFHISEPGLAMIGSAAVDHAKIARCLQAHRYSHWCSVEMKEPSSANPLDVVAAAARSARRNYGS
jgi:D-psicose/D-tagatose/L-ribulose 3-epimerase